jgi:putative protease
MKIPELLAPAGDLEKMKTALLYGADAVYCAGMRYGLRERATNFSEEELKEGIDFAHALSKKVYITVNAMPHNRDLEELPTYLARLQELKADALIISDPGVLMLAKKHAPAMEYHLSTQANTVNIASAQFWHEQGFSRLILARELSFEEINQFREHSQAELECFVHGAMCMAYSGRCLISNFLTGRDANAGDCAQACRWNYAVMEKNREGEYFPIEETEAGTALFYSKDLCMIEHLPLLMKTGIDGLKIEGRMKSLHYVATVTGVYRQAIDRYIKDPEHYVYDPQWMLEIQKAGTREFTTGFYFGKPGADAQSYSGNSVDRSIDFVGIVRETSAKGIWIEQRNNFKVGEMLEILLPTMQRILHRVETMQNREGLSITVAPHAQMSVFIPIQQPIPVQSLLRRIKGKTNP